MSHKTSKNRMLETCGQVIINTYETNGYVQGCKQIINICFGSMVIECEVSEEEIGAQRKYLHKLLHVFANMQVTVTNL